MGQVQPAEDLRLCWLGDDNLVSVDDHHPVARAALDDRELVPPVLKRWTRCLIPLERGSCLQVLLVLERSLEDHLEGRIGRHAHVDTGEGRIEVFLAAREHRRPGQRVRDVMSLSLDPFNLQVVRHQSLTEPAEPRRSDLLKLLVEQAHERPVVGEDRAQLDSSEVIIVVFDGPLDGHHFNFHGRIPLLSWSEGLRAAGNEPQVPVGALHKRVAEPVEPASVGQELRFKLRVEGLDQCI